ncbi:MAG: glycosyltransferase family 4 protein [Acidobacteriota bacterium]
MTKPLRILSIGHSYVIASNRALIREVAHDPGFEVTIAAPEFFHGDLRPLALDAEPDGSRLRVVGLKAQRTSLMHLFRYDEVALRRLLNEGEFDVVHAWEEPYIYAGYQIARTVCATSASYCFRTAQNQVKWYPPPFSYFERQAVARAQGWIAGGQLVYKAMLQRGYPAELGQVITLAVDAQAFRPLDAQTRAEVLAELGLEPPVIGFTGRLTAAKGLDVLMRAMEMVKKPEKWSLLLLGSGPYEERIVRWSQERGWADRVKIKLARHHEMPRYLGVMDMLVAPSQTTRAWREQFGRMLIEAFACGVPVIASDSGEIPFVVGNGGRIVPEHDVAAWSRAITELLTDYSTRAELARLGLERVKQYTVATVAEQYRNYYCRLAAQAE